MHFPPRLIALIGILSALSPALLSQDLVGASDGTANSRLGQAVLRIATLNADRIPEVLIGAPLANGQNGRVELRSGADFTLLRTLSGSAAERFGAAFAEVGDIDQDGFVDYAVLSLGDQAVTNQPGGVRVISGQTGATLRTLAALGADRGSGAALARQSEGRLVITTPNGLTNLNEVRSYSAGPQTIHWNVIQPSPLHTRFGAALSAGERTNGNSFVVVGTELFPEDQFNPLFRRGEVRVLDGNNGSVLWTALGANPLDRLGAAVAVLPDLDGDGHEDVAIGAPASDTFFTQTTGLVQLRSGATGALLRTLTGTTMDGRFGAAVARVGDFNGDGVDDLAVGAPGPQNSGTGEVFIIDPLTGTVLEQLNGLLPGADFGVALAGGGARREGLADVLVGAPLHASFGQASLFQSPSRPGSGRDFRLLTGANGPALRTDVHQVYGDEPMIWRLESPAASLVGQPFAFFAEIFPTGLQRGPFYGLPDSWVELNQAGAPWIELAAGLLPANGLEISLPALSGLGGLSAVLQGLIIDPNATNNYATTNAHEYEHLPPPVIYVDPNGSPTATGLSAASPLNSVAAAIALAESFGDPANFVPYPEILVAAGTYIENVQVSRPLNIRGGMDPLTWTRLPGQYAVIRTNNRGARFTGITGTATISGFEFQADNGIFSTTLSMNQASVALDVRSSGTGLQFDDCAFIAGRGAPGPNGNNGTSVGAAGNEGSNGGNGAYTLSTNSSGSGGGGGSGGINGGRGGNGGVAVCTSTIPIIGGCLSASSRAGSSGSAASGCNNGGSGGGRSTCGGASNGNPGGVGQPGGNGSPGNPSSQPQGRVLSNGDWSANWSSSGGTGFVGCGGGGGGGGGAVECAQQFASGGGGGGGGGGGRGGQGGTGAGQGGGSFAVWLHNASPRFLNCRFIAGQGGTGGNGGNGREGSAGGSGGTGGSGWGGTIAGFGIQSGRGGNGGDGGQGGSGGGGGGGNGGPSFCVFRAGSSNPPSLTGSGNAFTTGTGGIGGLGGRFGTSNDRAPSGNVGPVGLIGS